MRSAEREARERFPGRAGHPEIARAELERHVVRFGEMRPHRFGRADRRALQRANGALVRAERGVAETAVALQVVVERVIELETGVETPAEHVFVTQLVEPQRARGAAQRGVERTEIGKGGADGRAQRAALANRIAAAD